MYAACMNVHKQVFNEPFDHCILLECGVPHHQTLIISLLSFVPDILIAVLFFDVPVAVLLYMAITVMFPLPSLSLVKSVTGISRVTLS